MIFVTGPLYAGKQTYIQTALGLSDGEFARRAVRDVQELAVTVIRVCCGLPQMLKGKLP